MLSTVEVRFQDTIANAVDAGEKKLNASVECWKEVVNVETLDFKSVNNCLLAQLFGDYADALSVLGILVGELYGFDIPSEIIDVNAQLEVYDMLRDEWLGRIWNEAPVA